METKKRLRRRRYRSAYGEEHLYVFSLRRIASALEDIAATYRAIYVREKKREKINNRLNKFVMELLPVARKLIKDAAKPPKPFRAYPIPKNMRPVAVARPAGKPIALKTTD